VAYKHLKFVLIRIGSIPKLHVLDLYLNCVMWFSLTASDMM